METIVDLDVLLWTIIASSQRGFACTFIYISYSDSKSVHDLDQVNEARRCTAAVFLAWPGSCTLLTVSSVNTCKIR